MAGLKIYSQANVGFDFSQDGVFTNPLQVSIDGRTGGTDERRCYIKNDKPAVGYENIILSLVDAGGRNIVDGTDGYSWKLRVGDTQPTYDEWEYISDGNTITFENISVDDTITYLPFWLKIKIPKGASVESFSDVTLVLTADEIS